MALRLVLALQTRCAFGCLYYAAKQRDLYIGKFLD